jgi:hypothetical protein
MNNSVKVAVGLVICGLLSGKVMAQKPVEIKFHVKVKGYGDRWIRVDPGCKSGGKVIHKGDDYVTDRVMRGETMQVSIDDKSFTRACDCSFTLEAILKKNNRVDFRREISIPFKQEFKVPNDPQFSNVFVEVLDPIANDGKVSRRLPIGTR